MDSGIVKPKALFTSAETGEQSEDSDGESSDQSDKCDKPGNLYSYLHLKNVENYAIPNVVSFDLNRHLYLYKNFN